MNRGVLQDDDSEVEEIIEEEEEEVVYEEDDEEENESSSSSSSSFTVPVQRNNYSNNIIEDDQSEDLEDDAADDFDRPKMRALGREYLSSYAKSVSQHLSGSLLEQTTSQDLNRHIVSGLDNLTGYTPLDFDDVDENTVIDDSTPSERNKNLAEKDDSEFQESRTYLQKSLISCIQKSCPVEAGFPDSLCIMHVNPGTDSETIPGMDPSSIPVKYFCCITIPGTALVEGATRFGDFDRNTTVGRNAFRELDFWRRAFCDPGNGTDIYHDSAYRCPRENGICYTFSGGGVAPKVLPIVEPIFRKAYYGQVYPEECNIPIKDREIVITEMLVPDNIIGFRVWFFVIDFSIDPLDLIIRKIAKNREEMGLSPLYTKISENDPFVGAVSRSWFKGDPMKTFNYILKLNANATRENAHIFNQQRLFEERRKKTDPSLLISYEIKCISDVFNFFRCNECRCLKCGTHIRCNDCSALPMAYVKIAEDNEANARNFNYSSHAKFEPVPRGSMATVIIDGALLSPEEGVRNFARAFVDPVLYLNHTNPTALAMLNYLKCCPEQLDPVNYNKVDSNVNERLTFPFPALVFTFNPNDFGGDELLETRLPWAYDLFDITMDCIEEVVEAKRNNQNIVQDQAFFDSLTSTESREELERSAAITESTKRMIPEPIHPYAQGREYTAIHQQFNKAFLPMPGEVSSKDEKIIRGDNEIRDCALAIKVKIARLQKIINYIGGGTLRKLLDILQKQGMRDLKRLFIPDSKTPYIVRAASNILLNLIRKGRTAFSEMTRVAHNLESYSADFLLQLYFYFEGVGVLHNHHILLDIILSGWRASHCPITDMTYQHTTLLLNLILQGTAAVGKSFLAEVAAANMIPGSFPRKSSSSSRAINRVQPEDGRVEIIDELGPGLDPGKSGTPEDKEHISKTKERMTSFCLAHDVTELGSANGGAENVASRKTVTIQSEIHNALVAIGNDFSARPGEDDSYVSRFALMIVNSGVERKGTMDLTSKATPFGSSSITKLLTSPMTERQNVMVEMHARHVAYAKGIAVGAFIYPCLDILSFHFIPVYKRMIELIPSIGRTSRGAERLTSKALTMAIANGLYLIFNSIYSPLIHFKGSSKTIEYLPFTMDQLSLVQPYTFLPEDTAIGLIVEHFHNIYTPSLYWQVAMEIASMFANFGPQKQWTFKKTRIGQLNCVDVNYLHCDRKVGTIIAALGKRGINQYSARLIIRYLLVMEINVISVMPRPEDQLRKEGVELAQAPNKPNAIYEQDIEAANNYATKPMKVPVFQLETPTDRRYGHPDQMLEDSELYISVQYLQKFSPMQITQEIMKVICYKGIRPRRILLNVADEELPFLPKTWDIVPGEHSQSATSAETMHKHIKKALCSKDALSLPVREMADQLKSRSNNSVLFHTADAETELCKRWLTDNPVFDPARNPEDYTPKQINIDIANKTRNILINEKHVQYPEDILRYYDTLEIDQSLTGVECRPRSAEIALTAEQTAELENLIGSSASNPQAMSSAYQEQLASMVNRHASGQRNSSSSSSSSSFSSSSSSSSSSSTSQLTRLPYHRMTVSGEEPSAKKPRTASVRPMRPELVAYEDDF